MDVLPPICTDHGPADIHTLPPIIVSTTLTPIPVVRYPKIQLMEHISRALFRTSLSSRPSITSTTTLHSRLRLVSLPGTRRAMSSIEQKIKTLQDFSACDVGSTPLAYVKNKPVNMYTGIRRPAQAPKTTPRSHRASRLPL